MFSRCSSFCLRTSSGAERTHPSVRKMGSVHSPTEIRPPPPAGNRLFASSPAFSSPRVSLDRSIPIGPTTFGERNSGAPARLRRIACTYA